MVYHLLISVTTPGTTVKSTTPSTTVKSTTIPTSRMQATTTNVNDTIMISSTGSSVPTTVEMSPTTKHRLPSGVEDEDKHRQIIMISVITVIIAALVLIGFIVLCVVITKRRRRMNNSNGKEGYNYNNNAVVNPGYSTVYQSGSSQHNIYATIDDGEKPPVYVNAQMDVTEGNRGFLPAAQMDITEGNMGSSTAVQYDNAVGSENHATDSNQLAGDYESLQRNKKNGTGNKYEEMSSSQL